MTRQSTWCKQIAITANPPDVNRIGSTPRLSSTYLCSARRSVHAGWIRGQTVAPIAMKSRRVDEERDGSGQDVGLGSERSVASSVFRCLGSTKLVGARSFALSLTSRPDGGRRDKAEAV